MTRPAALLVWVFGVAGSCMVSGCAAGTRDERDAQMTQRVEILRRLDRLGTRDFHSPTWIASGWDHVRQILRDTEEVEWLAAHGDESVPEILERIRRGREQTSPDDIPKYYRELVAYFVVLEHAGEGCAVPVLVEYVEHLPDTEWREVGAPCHPFVYAMLALDKLCDLGLHRPGEYLPDAHELFLRRHEIVAQVRDKLGQRAEP